MREAIPLGNVWVYSKASLTERFGVWCQKTHGEIPEIMVPRVITMALKAMEQVVHKRLIVPHLHAESKHVSIGAIQGGNLDMR